MYMRMISVFTSSVLVGSLWRGGTYFGHCDRARACSVPAVFHGSLRRVDTPREWCVGAYHQAGDSSVDGGLLWKVGTERESCVDACCDSHSSAWGSSFRSEGWRLLPRQCEGGSRWREGTSSEPSFSACFDTIVIEQECSGVSIWRDCIVPASCVDVP